MSIGISLRQAFARLMHDGKLENYGIGRFPMPHRRHDVQLADSTAWADGLVRRWHQTLGGSQPPWKTNVGLTQSSSRRRSSASPRAADVISWRFRTRDAVGTRRRSLGASSSTCRFMGDENDLCRTQRVTDATSAYERRPTTFAPWSESRLVAENGRVGRQLVYDIHTKYDIRKMAWPGRSRTDGSCAI